MKLRRRATLESFASSLLAEKTDMEKTARESKARNHPAPDRYKRHKPTLWKARPRECVGCLKPFDYRNLTVDHVIPWTDERWETISEADKIENLQLLCSACNSLKSDGSNEDLNRHLHTIAAEDEFDKDDDWLDRLKAKPETK